MEKQEGAPKHARQMSHDSKAGTDSIRPRSITSFVLAVFVSQLFFSPASASVFDIYGFNPRGISLGGALTAPVDDYTATYYNPAALTVPKRINFGFGFTASFPKLTINRAKPESEFKSLTPSMFAGVTIGILFPFGGLLDNRLAVGASLYIPTLSLIRAEGNDPQYPQFYMYHNLPDKFIILLAGAGQITKWLSVGLGVQVLSDLFGKTDLELDVLNNRVSLRNISVEVSPKVSWTCGILVTPLEGLNIGVSYRSSIDLYFDYRNILFVGTVVQLNLLYEGRVLYSPHQINFGISYRVKRPDLLFTVDVDYSLWSYAPDPSPDLIVDIGGKIVEGFGLTDTFDMGKEKGDVPMNFVNTLTPRFGIEYTYHYWLKARAGYFYRGTPVPVQTEAYNYLDNDVHGISFGFAFTFLDPLQLHSTPFTLEIANQFMILTQRIAMKSNPNDPTGSLEHYGMIYSISVSLRHDY